ncbi:hypothetical protein J8J40_27325, partial [Mycobacterium tuberculosis]|nr:hypothetical protein [Mycobacterium tuberculosis]
EKDMAAAGKLAQASSPVEVGQIQLDYLQELLVDYNRQAMTVANASSKAVMASFSRLHKGR